MGFLGKRLGKLWAKRWATMASHTVLRSRVFHYNRAVPEDVQPFVGLRWWKVSLRTGDKREAEVKAREIAVAHDRLIASVRSKTERQRLEELETTAAELRQKIVAGFDKRLAAAQAAMKAGGIEALRIGSATQIKLAAKTKQSLTAQRGYQQSHSLIADYAVPAFQRERQAVLADATERLATLTESDRTAVESFGGIEALFYSTVSQEPPSDGDDSDDAIVTRHRLAQRKTLLRKLGIDAGGASDSNNPRLNSAMEQWFKERKQGDAAVKRHRTSIRRFTELHGNIPVGDVTKDMVRSYIKAIENLPDHRRLPTNMRGGLADPGKDVPRVAAPTVDRHLVSIKALLTFCVEQDWLKVNVATALKAPKDTRPKGSRRRSFTREERQQFLAAVVEEYGTDGDVTWFVLLVAYTGGRLEEIAQLARKNIKPVDGIWIVEVDDLDGRTIKEEPKQVPIHPAIREDFLAWYRSGKGDQLFASFRTKGGRFGNKLSGDMARLMDRAELTDPRLTFHSLRHTLKREMIKAGVDDEVRRAILGHAPKDAHEGYVGADLETMSREFAKMQPLF